eukprot:m.480796 g.480796  ORF g.480796 m.480796 type:complete len:216 (-) comp21955_c0_seq1:62-709(-)
MARFEPYSQNGGTVVGIAGDDFAVIASDTRLSEDYSIHSRNSTKIHELTDSMVLGSAGFHGDVLTLLKQIRARLKMYKYNHNETMSAPSAAQMLSTMLYSHRFFPYYTYNVLAGIDEHGKGCVYGYDPVGNYERESCRAAGSASSLLQPLLDNQISKKNQQNPDETPLTKERVVSLLKDVFTGAGERDIYTGDGVDICVITAEGVSHEFFPLRRD